MAVQSRVLSDSVILWTAAARLLCPRDSPGKNTGVSCHFPLQGILSIQGSKPCLLGLLHWQANSLPLSHPTSPVIDFKEQKVNTHSCDQAGVTAVTQQRQCISADSQLCSQGKDELEALSRAVPELRRPGALDQQATGTLWDGGADLRGPQAWGLGPGPCRSSRLQPQQDDARTLRLTQLFAAGDSQLWERPLHSLRGSVLPPPAWPCVSWLLTHHQVSPVSGNQCVCMPAASLLLTWDERGNLKSCTDLSERLTSAQTPTWMLLQAWQSPGGPARGPGTPRRHLVGVALSPPLLLLALTALNSGCPGHWGEASTGCAHAPDVQLRSALRPGLPAPGRPRLPHPTRGPRRSPIL